MSSPTGPIATVSALVRANLQRLLREKSNYFFILALPLMIVFALGVAVADSATSSLIGVVNETGTQTASMFRHRLDASDSVRLVDMSSEADLRLAIARKAVDAGYVVTGSEGHLKVEWFAAPEANLELRSILQSALTETNVRGQVAQVVADQERVSLTEAADLADKAGKVAPKVEVKVSHNGAAASISGAIRSSLAGGQLTLFLFLTAMAGSGYLLTSRLYGVTRRTQAAPVRIGWIILGEALGRFVVALIQAAIIFFGSILLFGVDWKEPLAVWLLCLGMGMVGTGAAMLLGTVGRSEQQVGAIATTLSLVLAAIGGSMQPLAFFPDTMRTLAFLTPHAWMNDALWTILVKGGGLAQVWPAILVLVAEGLALLGLATWMMRRSLR